MAVVFLLLLSVASTDDKNRDFVQLVQEHQDLVVDALEVQTQDGYLLCVHRVHKREGASKGPVLLQHGLLDSSDTWILNFRDRSLGFMLADEGFDVFFGNSRGNKYQRGHRSLSTSEDAYWDFSWDEMALRDLPAVVDAVLGWSGHVTLAYVGHSQGCAIMFAALVSSEAGASLAAKVSHFYALAPVTFASHTTSPLLKTLAGLHFDEMVQSMGVRDFMPSSGFMRRVLPWFCTTVVLEWMCDSAIYFAAGFNPSELEQDRKEVFFAHYPAGTSVKDMVHWAQNIRAGQKGGPEFSRYDYGTRNVAVYGTAEPPPYQLDAFPPSVPVTIFHGGDDALANPTDVSRLLDRLSRHPRLVTVNLPKYDHLDFVWGATAHIDIYRPVITGLNAMHEEAKARAASDTTAKVSPAVLVPLVATACGVLAVAAVAGLGWTRVRRNRSSRVRVCRPASGRKGDERPCPGLEQSLLV